MVAVDYLWFGLLCFALLLCNFFMWFGVMRCAVVCDFMDSLRSVVVDYWESGLERGLKSRS